MLIEIVGEDIEVAILTDESAVDTAVIGVANPIELLRVIHRKRAKQDALDQRKDRRICTDAQGQGYDRREREARRFAQPAQRILNVLNRVMDKFGNHVYLRLQVLQMRARLFSP